MKIKCLYILILLISVVSISCEKTVDNIDYPDYKPMLVIYSFISPSDTVLRVHISTTKNIYGQKVDYPKSLPVTVMLIDNGQSLPFSSMDSSGYCYLKHSVEAGKQYKITAKCAGYPDAFGECKIPDLKDVNITIDTSTVTNHYPWGDGTLSYAKVIFRDIPNETDYYNISCILTYNYMRDTIYTKQSEMLSIHMDDNDYRQTIMISDHLIDGQLISIPFIYDGYYSSYLTNLEFEASVLMTDADYYQYHKSLQTYTGSDEPFSEFSPVYTNITGGLGVFCSYVRYKKTLQLK